MSKQFVLTPKLMEAIRTVKVPSKHYDCEIAPTFPEFLYLYGKYMKMPWLQKEALHMYADFIQMEEEPWEWLQIVGLLGKSGQIVKKGKEYIQQVLEKAEEGN